MWKHNGKQILNCYTYLENIALNCIEKEEILDICDVVFEWGILRYY